jgi:hypothetical protein
MIADIYHNASGAHTGLQSAVTGNLELLPVTADAICEPLG